MQMGIELLAPLRRYALQTIALKGALHPHGKDYLPYAATGFRDFTRIASSHPAVWTDICLANRPALLKLTGDLKEQLSKLEQLLSDGNKTELYRYFEEAAQMRNDWLKNR